jgi:hypothetical protein
MLYRTVSRFLSFKALAGAVLVAAALPSHGNNNGLVVYLSAYLSGDYYYAPVPDLVPEQSQQQHIQPVKLSLPKDFRRSVELGNHDISADGQIIVFAARTKRGKNWDIYTGTPDYDRAEITNVQRIIHESGAREEDPRFDWSRDASGLHRVVYKCDGDICIYDGSVTKVVEEAACELWAPSFNSEGTAVSYVQRCDGPESDRIWYAYLNAPYDREEVPRPGNAGGPDRFSHFLDSDSLVYSHIMPDSGAAALWRYDGSSGNLAQLTFNENTNSDDDAYPDKSNPGRIAYIGWQEGTGYNLFIYENQRSHKLSHGVPMLAPAIFRPSGSPEPPPPPPPSGSSVHVGDLDVATGAGKRRWWSRVTVELHDADENPVSGASVTFDTGAGNVSCQTGDTGRCTTKRLNQNNSVPSLTYTVVSVSDPNYNAGENHDPDGDSNGTSITALRP